MQLFKRSILSGRGTLVKDDWGCIKGNSFVRLLGLLFDFALRFRRVSPKINSRIGIDRLTAVEEGASKKA